MQNLTPSTTLLFFLGFILPDQHYIQQEIEIKQLIERYNSEQLLNDRTGKQIKGIDDEFAVNNLLISFEENLINEKGLR